MAALSRLCFKRAHVPLPGEAGLATQHPLGCTELRLCILARLAGLAAGKLSPGGRNGVPARVAGPFSYSGMGQVKEVVQL